MIDSLITQEDFIAKVQNELAELLKSAKDEYAGELQRLSVEFTEQYYKLLNGTTDGDRKRAEANIRHIKATLTHISARMGLDVVERLIAVCSAVLAIAVSAAINAII